MNMGKMGKACMLTFSALNWAQFQPFATCFHMFSPLQHVSDLSPDDMLAWQVVGQWARKEVYPTEKVDITKPQAVRQGPVQQGPTGSNISCASVAGRRKQHQPPLHQRVEGLNDSKDFRVYGEKMVKK